jgi:hypothetical protein
VDDFDRESGDVVRLKQRLEAFFLADENDGNAVLRGRLNGALDFNGRRTDLRPSHRLRF